MTLTGRGASGIMPRVMESIAVRASWSAAASASCDRASESSRSRRVSAAITPWCSLEWSRVGCGGRRGRGRGQGRVCAWQVQGKQLGVCVWRGAKGRTPAGDVYA